MTPRRLSPATFTAALLAGTLAALWWSRGVTAPEVSALEAFSWRLADAPRWLDLLRRVGHDTQGPLHFVALRAWMAVWGDSPAALRSLSVVCTALGVVFAVLAVQAALGCVRTESSAAPPHPGPLPGGEGTGGVAPTPDVPPRSGGLLCALPGEEGTGGGPGAWLLPAATTALLLVLGPLETEAARQGRCYGLGVLLAALSSWLLLQALRAERRRVGWWAAYGTSAALFALTHYYAFFALAGQAIFVALETALAWRAARRAAHPPPAPPWKGGESALTPRPAIAAARGFVLASSLALALYSPWLPVLRQQMALVREHFWIDQPRPIEVLHVLFSWSAGTAYPGTPLAAGWFALLTLLAAHGALRCGAGGRLFLLQAALPWVASLAWSAASGRSIFLDRYFVLAHVSLACLWGVNVGCLTDRAARWLAAAVAVSLPLAGPWWPPPREPVLIHGGAAVVAALKPHYRQGDLILAGGADEVCVLRYYARRVGLAQADIRCRASAVRPAGWAGYATALEAEDALPSDEGLPPEVRRVWVVVVAGHPGPRLPEGFALAVELPVGAATSGERVLRRYDR